MKGRRLRAGALVGAVVLVGTACAPFWGPTGSITVTMVGELTTVSWSAATGAVASYEMAIDGRPPVIIPAPATSCVLTGLPPATLATISVTARNTANEWSGTVGGAGKVARLDASLTTPAGAGTGSTPGCVSTTDTDGDRLPDAVETGTGVYVDVAHTGSNPTVADTDGDGIKDGDEVLGTTGGLNLRALGTKPTKKDILLEFDWFQDSLNPGQCPTHSHQPKPAEIALATAGFANSPVPNPDGTTGVNLISDYGQGGAFTGGNLIADPDGVIAGGVGGADFLGYKAANFAANRKGYFHWVLKPHNYNTSSLSSGQAEINGDDLIVSLQCYGTTIAESNTIAHELGHNIGLRHGGNEDTNYKPNYNSVMNYKFQFPGVDTNCDGAGDGLLNYSVGARASLNENGLSEATGICGGVAKDWNGSGGINPGTVAADINNDGTLTTLNDFNDWAALNFGGIGDANGGARVGPTEIITEEPVPVAARR